MLYALKGNVCAEYLKNAWQHRLAKPKLTSSSVMHKSDGEGGDQVGAGGEDGDQVEAGVQMGDGVSVLVSAGVQLGDGVSVLKLIRHLSWLWLPGGLRSPCVTHPSCFTNIVCML